jgi:hypothetical protein
MRLFSIFGYPIAVRDALDPTPYSMREVENTLDELVVHEKKDFEKIGAVYQWTKHYRFRTR